MAEIDNQQLGRADMWERWGWVWSAVFYISLLVSLGWALIDDDLSPSEMEYVLLLSGASALWHLVGAWYLPRRFPDFRGRPVLMAGYLLIAFLLWWALVNIHAVFYFMLFGLYGQIFSYLSIRLAIPFAIVFSGLMIIDIFTVEGSGLAINQVGFWVLVGGTAASVLIALWLNAIINQSAERRVLIEQLQATQEELAQAEREAGILAERQRLGREIHDTLAQGFASIVMHLEAAEQALPPEAAMAQHHVDEARKVARESLAEARELVWSLRPGRLQNHTLPEAIERVVKQWSVSTGVHAGTLITGDVLPLHPQAEVALLRAVQEGLANVRKHAAASEVIVTLSYLFDVVVLDVQDNGLGFDVNGRADNRPGLNSGYGLPAMRERVAQLGGTMTVESAIGEGTTLALEIPV